MVSLKKEPRVREYTPEHLMDEEESVRRFCPPRGESVNKAEISIKKNAESNINFNKSMHGNPFAYIRSEKDILKLVNTIISNTKDGGDKSDENFWIKAERVLYTAYIGYIYYEIPEEEQNFNALIEMIDASEVREDDENFKNPIDLLFEQLENKNPAHFAVKQYKQYKLVSGKTAKSMLISCRARLASIDVQELCKLMAYDDKVEKFLETRGEIVTLDENRLADNLPTEPTEESNSKPKRSIEILMLVVQIICFLGCFASMFAGFEHGAQAISTNGLSLSVIAEMFPFVASGAFLSLTPSLVRRLLDCRRW